VRIRFRRTGTLSVLLTGFVCAMFASVRIVKSNLFNGLASIT